jgi:tetratricopeptide (TPR) repeat protein
MMQTGSFCESDKYSFVLAFDKVVGMLPQKLLDMLENGEATMVGGQVEAEERRSPAYIRRIYLQDIYRFFKLYSYRSLFQNPFEEDYGNKRLKLIFANQLLHGTDFEKCMCEVAAFLIKRRQYEDAKSVLNNCSDRDQDFQYFLLCGTVLLHGESSDSMAEKETIDYFSTAVRLKPDSERALAGYARAVFNTKDYQKALDAYDRLLLMHEGHKSYQLNKVICLSNLQRYEEALKILYQMDYERPDDHHIQRVMAWTLLGSGKLQQAGKIYEKLLGTDKPVADDVLNDGLRLWLSGDIMAAEERFSQVAELRNEPFDVDREFDQETIDLLRWNGISEVEIQLMKEELAHYSQG